MSEPTSSGNDQSDPDPHKHQEKDADRYPEQDQDQAPGSVFSDPTAPVWTNPTAPMPPAPPVPPTPPSAAAPDDERSYGQQPTAGQQPADQPPSNPYAQQPPVQPYGEPQPGQQYPSYGQQPPSPYGQQPPEYGQQSYAPAGQPASSNTSAIILTVLSALSLCNFLAVAPLVIGIIALTKNTNDPKGSRRLTKIGWIVFAAVWALAIVGLVIYAVFLGTMIKNGNTSDLSSSF